VLFKNLKWCSEGKNRTGMKEESRRQRKLLLEFSDGFEAVAVLRKGDRKITLLSPNGVLLGSG